MNQEGGHQNRTPFSSFPMLAQINSQDNSIKIPKIKFEKTLMDCDSDEVIMGCILLPNVLYRKTIRKSKRNI